MPPERKNFDGRALAAALAANDAWAPPGNPRPLDEITPPGSLLPDAALSAATDLGYDREEAEAILTVFCEHAGSFQQLSVEQVLGDHMGRAITFSMFWAYLAAQREQREFAR